MKRTATLTLVLFTFFTAAAQKKQIDSLRLALSNAKTDTKRYEALHNLDIGYSLSNPDSSLLFAQQAYLLAKKNNWARNQANCLNNMAGCYTQLGDYVKAVSFYFKALKIAGELNDLYLMSLVNDNIGAACVQQQDYKKALVYLRVALEQLNNFALSHKLLLIHKKENAVEYLDIGECYLDMRRADSAAYYLDTAFADCKKLNFVDYVGAVQRDLGEVEAEKGNKAAGLGFFRQAIMNEKAVNDIENESIAYLSTANLYHKYKQQDSAAYYAKKALETAADGKFEQDVLNAGKVLYTFYDEGHNLPQAYKYFKLATAAKDSLYSRDKVKQLLSIDFDEKERRQELQTAQKEAQTEAQNRLRTYILSGGLGVLLLLAIIFWRNSSQRKKANRLLSKQKRETEEQRDQTNKALNDLKLTQNQLIQSEKMASLGELTAGIAHEIQNPLNFVNNFSEVNREMLQELKAETEKPKAERDERAEIELINALVENEEKINHHGKRADLIVKGMLQHSRTSTGERQLTNMNVLAEKFFKLSYQGMRVKDKAFNAELITYFDPGLPKIAIVQQDIERVLLNLFNNAFYAVNQKQKTAGAGYRPAVELATAPQVPTAGGEAINGIVITVRDNGAGIPEAIKDKIMQPFFTTKPTGEGTGLGLSLAYDIVVKGHGGTITVDSHEGSYALFTITLPLAE